MRLSLVAIAGFLLLIGASVASLVALGGYARGLTSGAVSADVHLHAFAVPREFRVDRNELSDSLLRQIEERAATDVGLRMSLDELGQKQLTDLIIPRLINPSVVARLIEDVPALSTILGIGDYKSAAEIVVSNNTDANLDDVVVLLPGLIGAQDANGAAAAVVTTESGLTALTLGTLAPRESRALTAWMRLDVPELQAVETQIRVGAAGGLDGRVHLFGHTEWIGKDLEVLPWTRWVVGFVVAFTGMAALAALVVMALRARQRVGANA
ncbi:MAG TPA: hypothetical protein VFE52_06315 [Devosia sp.]|nr:hypothetical protein [Devosia sp.]